MCSWKVKQKRSHTKLQNNQGGGFETPLLLCHTQLFMSATNSIALDITTTLAAECNKNAAAVGLCRIVDVSSSGHSCRITDWTLHCLQHICLYFQTIFFLSLSPNLSPFCVALFSNCLFWPTKKILCYNFVEKKILSFQLHSNKGLAVICPKYLSICLRHCSFWTLAIVCSIVKDFFIWIHLDLIMLSSLVFKLHHTQPTNHTHLNIFEIIWKYWRLFFVFHFFNLTQNWKCDIILESFSNSI